MLHVAITGALSMPRKDAAELINSTSNAQFHPEVTYETHYLFAARFDSNKAKKAAQIGVRIISEQEMLNYVKAGSFTPVDAPTRPPHPEDFPTIQWTKRYSNHPTCFLEYNGSDETITQRYVTLLAEGHGSNGHDYIEAFYSDWAKTFRRDRIKKLEIL